MFSKFQQFLVSRDARERSYSDGIELLCGGNVEWVESQLRVPSKMVQGGRDLSENLAYVCQAILEYFGRPHTLPGQYVPALSCCKVVFDGKEHCLFSFKVLQTI